MKFEISLNNLKFYSFHGVLEEERRLGNEYDVSLMVEVECEKVEKDELSSTVSYADLYDIITAEMAIPRNLLEKVAYEIARRTKERFPQVLSGKITVTKLRPPIEGMLGTASVSLVF